MTLENWGINEELLDKRIKCESARTIKVFENVANGIQGNSETLKEAIKQLGTCNPEVKFFTKKDDSLVMRISNYTEYFGYWTTAIYITETEIICLGYDDGAC